MRHEILRNLRDLRDLRRLEARLPPSTGASYRVRVYAAAPPIQLYRRGERITVSFVPHRIIDAALGRPGSDGDGAPGGA